MTTALQNWSSDLSDGLGCGEGISLSEFIASMALVVMVGKAYVWMLAVDYPNLAGKVKKQWSVDSGQTLNLSPRISGFGTRGSV